MLALICEQHIQILDALVQQDGIRASEAMRLHIKTSLDYAMEHLEDGLED
jgi:DNA-binding GntR family transcriptional regulator